MSTLKLRIASLLVMVLLVVGTTQAQKFGFINSQELLISSPEVKTADEQLEAFQNTLVAKGKTMVTEFEKEYNSYMQEAAGKSLSPVQMQQKEADLTAKQQAIQKYEMEVQQQIGAKREELYKPIIDKINLAIEQVGKEGNYTMIFDAASGALLHAIETENILEKVKAKL